MGCSYRSGRGIVTWKGSWGRLRDGSWARGARVVGIAMPAGTSCPRLVLGRVAAFGGYRAKQILVNSMASTLTLTLGNCSTRCSTSGVHPVVSLKGEGIFF